MASVGVVWGWELRASRGCCASRGFYSSASGDPSCRRVALHPNPLVLRKSVRLAGLGKQGCEATTGNGAMSWNSSGNGSPGIGVEKYRSRLEALLYCGKEIPEEKIDKPTGVPTKALSIGNRPRCFSCEAKGAVQCPTCSGSGLYVDSILESQGIIVKMKCLGCGGTGSTMCPKCGGRGHA